MSVPRTGNRGLVGASASSMLREGDWSHVKYLTSIVIFPMHMLSKSDKSGQLKGTLCKISLCGEV